MYTRYETYNSQGGWKKSSLKFDLPALKRRVIYGGIISRKKKYILQGGNYGNFGCEANSEVETWTTWQMQE